MVLHLQLVEHQSQLFAVLRHIVGLTADEQIAALADLIDVLSREFGHLGGAACCEDLLTHKLTGIHRCRLGSRLEGWGILSGFRRGIDGQQDTVVREGDVRGDTLGVKLH